MGIIGPHLGVGNRVQRGPKRNGFVRLDGRARTARGDKDAAMERVTVQELKMQFASKFRVMGLNTQLLTSLAHGCFMGRFTRFDAPAGAINFSGPKAPLFSNEKNLTLADHKKQNSPFRGLP